jgi:hypothetical protein
LFLLSVIRLKFKLSYAPPLGVAEILLDLLADGDQVALTLELLEADADCVGDTEGDFVELMLWLGVWLLLALCEGLIEALAD